MGAAEIGLLSSMTQIQNLSQSQHLKNQPPPPPPPPQPQQQNPNSTTTTATSTWMWNPREHQDEDDSWEVRAFAEDTRNIMGTTWPPRSYTCTFCRREFRSAQALGGHMNVHRRDRARLHQTHPATAAAASSLLSSHPIIRTSHPTQASLPPPRPPPPFINVPPQELVANAGLCLLYHMPSPNASIGEYCPSNNVLSISSSSSSSSPYLQNSNLMVQNFHSATTTVGINSISNSSYCGKVEEAATTSAVHNGRLEELDLELRLGHRPTPT